MPDRTPDLEAVTRMVADKIALAHAMFDGTGRAPFVEFGFSDAEDIRRALEQAKTAAAAYRVVREWLVIDTDLAGGSHLADAARFANAMDSLAPAPGEEGKDG